MHAGGEKRRPGRSTRTKMRAAIAALAAVILALSSIVLAATSAPDSTPTVRCPMTISLGEILDCVVMDLGPAEVRLGTQGNGSGITMTLPRIGSTTIRLQLVSLFTPDALVAEFVNGEWVYSRPEPKTYVGWVDGDATARVRLTLLRSSSMGSIRMGGETFQIEPAAKYIAEASPATVIIYSERDFRGNGGIDVGNYSIRPPVLETPPPPSELPYSNGTETFAVAPLSPGSLSGKDPIRPTHTTIPSKAYARIFLASDDEYRATFSDWKDQQQGSVQAIDDIYSYQLDVHFRIAGQFALATSDLSAPILCSNTDPNNVLLKFRNKIENDPTIGPTAIPRDVSLLTSTRSFSPLLGCAFQSSLAGSYAYAVTALTEPIGNVMLHEIGHVFGGYHQDDPNRPANTGAHQRGTFPGFFCWDTWSYSIYSIMWTPLYFNCMEGAFSDGSVQADRNNRAYMLNNVAGPRLRKVGQNLVPGSGSSFSSSGDLWGHTPGLVGDGATSTYWWANAEVSWLQITLPASRYIERLEIHGWSGYYMSSFSMKLSPDGSSWTTVFTGGSISTVDFNIHFRAMWARYIKLEVYDIYMCCGALNEYAVLREIELFETANVASWQPGTSSGNYWGHMPQEAVDENLATYWWGTASSGSWIQYEFAETCAAYLRLRMFPGYGVLGLRVYAQWTSGSASTDYWWGSPQEDLLLPTGTTSCATDAIKLTFLDNANGGYNDYPVVRELEVYYGE